MTDKEAMAMALDALEPFTTPNWAGSGVDKCNEAIAAIKEALAQPEQEPVGYVYSESGVKSAAIQRNLPNGTPLYTHPPQPEPVAGFYLPIRKDMREDVEALIDHAKRARWTNVVVRKDAVETTYEADWIKELIPYTPPAQPPQENKHD